MVTKNLELYHTSIKIIMITRIVEIHTNYDSIGFYYKHIIIYFRLKNFDGVKDVYI